MAIFRYLTYEGGKATLANGTLKATPPLEFNDPFDMDPGWAMPLNDESLEKLFQGAGDKVLRALESAKQFYNSDPVNFTRRVNSSAHQQAREGLNAKLRAVCFSRRKDSVPMWGYYCSCHSGLVIEFDEEDDAFRTSFGGSLKRVNYLQDRPSFTRLSANNLALMFTKALGTRERNSTHRIFG